MTVRMCLLAGCAVVAVASAIVIVGIAVAELVDEARGIR